MHALAEFIMRGRAQAALITVVGAFFLPLTLVSMGLVTLRKGWLEGAFLLLWAPLPYIGAFIVLDVDAFALLAPLAAILISYVLALTLRRQTSWQLVLLTLVVITALVSLILDYVLVDLIFSDASVLRILLASQEQAVQENQELLDLLNSPITAGQIAYYFIAKPVLVGLIMARYMQASLYNPGGFQAEIVCLRIAPAISIPAMLGFVLCNLMGEGYQEWAIVLALPLLANGISVAQSVFLATGWRTVAIVLFYVAVFILHPLVLLLIVLGVSDIWLDYRKRFNLER